MKSTKSLMVITLLSSALAVSAWAAVPGRGGEGGGEREREGRNGMMGGATTRPQGGRQGRGPAAPGNLEQAMSDMDRAYRTVKADAADASRQTQVLTALDTMVRDAAISKMFVPPTVRRQPAEKQAESLKSYRSMMTGLIKSLLDLEDAVNDKKADDVKKGIAEIDEIMKHGHDEFAPQR